MANALITSSFIANETLRIIHNESAFLGNINRAYDKNFAQDGKKAGDTVTVRRPVQYTVRSGATAAIQDVNETSVSVTIAPEFGIDFQFTDFDLALKTDKFSERYLVPAGRRLATEIDARIAALYTNVANFSGTPGTVPATAAAILDAQAVLDLAGCPRGDRRVAAVGPRTNAALVSGMSGLFNDQATLARQLKNGMMASNVGCDFMMSQNVPTHTVGALGGTGLVNGASQGTYSATSTENPYASYTDLVTDGWSNSITGLLKAGDVITLGLGGTRVESVNPETRVTTGELKTFTVLTDVNSSGAGAATIRVSPAIIASGAYQNVNVRPADNAAITIKTGTAATAYMQNMIYHKDAFTLATVDMDLPNGMDMASRANYDGVALRFVRGFDITNNKRICRFDMLAGVAAIRPEFAVRLTS